MANQIFRYFSESRKLQTPCAPKSRAYPWRTHQCIDRFVFLHIHKTAGSAIKQNLGLPYKRASHATASHIASALGLNEYLSRISFCVVRNPYDRLVSAYCYRTETGRVRKISFQDFVLSRSRNYARRLPLQIDYLTIDGRLEVNDILKYESLDSDYAAFSEKHFGEPYSLRPVNVSESRTSKNFMSWYRDPDGALERDLIDRVNMLYEPDFSALGYDML